MRIILLFLCCSIGLFAQEIIRELTKYEKQGIVYLRQGDYHKAKKIYTQALDLSKKHLGDGHYITGNFLMRMANIHYFFGDLPSAIKFAEQALNNSVQNYGSDHPTTASYLNNLALFYSDAGNLVSAKETYEKALAIKEKLFGKDSINVATVIGNIAHLQKVLGHFYEARVLYERETQLRKKHMGSHISSGIALQNLASVYSEMGNYNKAVQLYNEAFTILNKTIPKQHPHWGAFYNNMAHLFSSMGNFPNAKEYALRALEIGSSVDAEHANIAVMSNNLAMLMMDMGDWASAQKYLQNAIMISQKKLGEEHHDTITYKKNMADLLDRLGNREEAQQLLEIVHQTQKKIFGENHLFTLNTNIKLASLLLKTNPNAAEKICRDAITKLSLQKQQSIFSYTSCLQIFVGMLQKIGKKDEALKYAHECLELCEQYFGSAHLDTQATLSQLATLYMEKGEVNQAKKYAQIALQYAQNHLFQIAPFLPLRQQHEYIYKNFLLHLDVALSFHPETTIYSGLFAYRGFILRSIQARYQNFKGQNWEKYVSVCRRYSALAIADAKNFNELHKLRIEKEQWEESLAKNHIVAAQHNWQDIQKKLTNHSVMIDFLHYNHYTFSDGQWNSRKKIAAFVIEKDSLTRINIELPQNIEQNVLVLRQLLQNNIGKRKYFSNPSIRQLYISILEPFLPFLKNKRILYVAPDGFLASIPWEALPASLESKKYLLEMVKIYYIHMPYDLLYDRKSSNQGLLVVSDVNYFAQAKNVSPSVHLLRGGPKQWSNLPGTKQEGLDIYNLYQEKNKVILSQDLASEKNFLSQSPGKEFIRFATHSFFNSIETGTAKIKLPYTLDQEYIPYWNPLLYSGIVMAGANLESKQEDDGVITAEELAVLPLQGTKLMVLSSCESGLGYSIHGQGLAGLRSASFCAGVQNLVVSLWKVPDMETSKFMETFYQKLLQKKLTPAVALYQSKLEFIHQGKAPQVWAAFVLLGK